LFNTEEINRYYLAKQTGPGTVLYTEYKETGLIAARIAPPGLLPLRCRER
jgi:hypothetical protein